MRRLHLAFLAKLVLFTFASSTSAQDFDYSAQPGYNPATGQGAIRGENHFVSFGTTGFDGVYINNLLGANRFYTNGFTGAGTVMTNIEAGVMAGAVGGLSGQDGGLYAGGHQTLTHVNTFYASTSNPLSTLDLVDRHATWVGHAMGGKGNGDNVQQGMAPDATMHSAGIATSWNGATGYRTSFNFATRDDMLAPYRAAILNDRPATVTAALAATARVTNSSWGFSDPTGSAFGDTSRGVDALTYSRGTTGNAPAVVFSAGNSGLGDGTVAGSRVGGPAAGYNVISVGALGADPAFDTVSSFSSRGPMPVFVPLINNPTNINNPAHGTIINSARGRVDISAPGQQLTLGYYGGTTGGNAPPSEGGTPNGGPGFYSTNVAGTSFAAPTVAGGLALMANAASVQLGGANNALDGRVMKAVLLNAADKTAGWSNAATGTGTTGSPYHTTQALDRNVGAGRMNLNKAYDQYLSGTTGVANPQGGNVGNLGWAFGSVSQALPTSDYRINTSLLSGSNLSATMSFFVNRSIDSTNNTLEGRFDNLDLEVYSLASLGGPILPANRIAFSDTIYDTTEHIYFNLPASGFYAIRVLWSGLNWNFTGTNGAAFGLAWSATPVPEPLFVLSIAAGGLLVIVRRRRRLKIG